MLITRTLYNHILQEAGRNPRCPALLSGNTLKITDLIDRATYALCCAFYNRKSIHYPSLLSFLVFAFALCVTGIGWALGALLRPDSHLHSPLRYEFLYLGYAGLFMMFIIGLGSLMRGDRSSGSGILICIVSFFLTGLMLSVHSWPIPVLQWPSDALFIETGFGTLLGLNAVYLLPVRLMIALLIAVVLFRTVLSKTTEIPDGIMFAVVFFAIEVVSFPILTTLVYLSPWMDLSLLQSMIYSAPLFATSLTAYAYTVSNFTDTNSYFSAAIMWAIAASFFHYVIVKFSVAIAAITSPAYIVHRANCILMELNATSNNHEKVINTSETDQPKPVFTLSFELVVFLSLLSVLLPLYLLIELALLFVYYLIRRAIVKLSVPRITSLRKPDLSSDSSSNDALLGNPKHDKIALWATPLLTILLLPLLHNNIRNEFYAVHDIVEREYESRVAQNGHGNDNVNDASLTSFHQAIIDQAYANNPLSIVVFPSDNRQFEASVTINGIETTMLIDTGADTILAMQFAIQNNLPVSQIRQPLATVGGIGYGSKCVISSFELHGLRFAHHIEITCSTGLDISESEGKHLLGMDILRYFNVVIRPTYMILTPKPQYGHLWSRQ